MADLNQVIIMGRLTEDPELRQTPSGDFACSFTIACNRRKDRDGNEKADFITISAFKHNAQFVSRYFHKGKPIVVHGELRSRTYQDKNSVTHYVTEVRADEVYFAGQTKAEKESEAHSRTTAYSSSSDFNPDDFEEVSG